MRLWVVALMYTLAFVAALATLWAFTVLQVMDLFAGRIDSLFVMLMFQLLSAMAVFSLVYGLASGRALKWRYWLVTGLALGALAVVVPRLVMAGVFDAMTGFVATVLLVFVGGFPAALYRDARLGQRRS